MKKLFIIILVFNALFSCKVFADEVNILLILPHRYGANYNFNRDHFEKFGWTITTTGVTEVVEPCYADLPSITVDVLIADIEAVSEYDAVAIMPCTWRYQPDPYGDLIGSEETLNLISTAVDSGLAVWATCVGPRVLAAADVLDGVVMQGRPGENDEYLQEYLDAGAIYQGTGLPPVIDGNIITTTRGQYYQRENCEAIATVIENSQNEQRYSEVNGKLASTTTHSIRDNEDAIWIQSFGGADAEGGRCVSETTDGGFIIAGYTYSFGAGNSDVYLIKTDADGNELWSNTFGGTGWEYGNSVCQSADGGFIVAGYTTSLGAGSKDVYLIKTDAEGNELWSTTFGGAGVDIGMSVCETSDDHLLICGYTESYGAGENNVYLIKADAFGDTIWTQTYGGDGPETMDEVHETSDGNYIMVGASGSYSENYDAYLIKTDSDGNVIWSSLYDAAGADGGYDRANSVAQTSDAGYIIAGDSNAPDICGVYFIKTDGEGNELNHTFLGNSFYDYGNSILESSDSGYLICGATKDGTTTKNDVYVAKLNSDGDAIWTNSFGDENGSEWGSSIYESSDGNYVIVGQTESYGAGSFDVWLLKIPNPLHIDFEAVPNTGHLPLEANFMDNSFGNITSWQWDFNNDGIIDSEDENPTYIYEEAGDYTVTLEVSDGSNSQTLTRENYIRVFSGGESALEFDGQISHASCESSEMLNLTEFLTIEAWINPSGWGESGEIGYGRIVDKNKFTLCLIGESSNFNDHSLSFQVFQESGPPSFSFTPENSIILDEWQHVAVTYSVDSGVQMYINGVLQEIIQTVPPSNPIADNSQYDLIVGNSDDNGFAFDGVIDEVRIWNIVRSSAEIESNISQLLAGDEQGLAAYWKMNEGYDELLTDGSGNENDAQINYALWVQGTPFVPTDVKDEAIVSVPKRYTLHQNYPNPFNPQTTIGFELPIKSDVKLSIYDITGKLIKILVDEEKEAGYHSVVWNGTDENKKRIASGLYFYQIESDGYNQVKRCLLLK